MTFEEFFKKKRIDLLALQAGESSLFTEFESHFTEMGEKSFDHTKKYWFNKLRRQFPLAPEVKTEKVAVANPLAEQTITESLIDVSTTDPSPKVGFTPRFKAGVTSKPVENAEPSPEVKPDTPTPSPKVGFTPRFKAGVTSKPVENAEPTPEVKPEVPVPLPKVGFTPRFKAGVTTKAAENVEPTPKVNPEASVKNLSEEKPVENTTFKPAFKPRFNMKTMPPKPPEE